jgi:hypothetical protein
VDTRPPAGPGDLRQCGSAIAGAGHAGAPWQESLVSAGLVSVGLTMLAGMLLASWGFVKARLRWQDA